MLGYRERTAARTLAFWADVPWADTRLRALRAWDLSWIGYLRDFGNTNALAGRRRLAAAVNLAMQLA